MFRYPFTSKTRDSRSTNVVDLNSGKSGKGKGKARTFTIDDDDGPSFPTYLHHPLGRYDSIELPVHRPAHALKLFEGSSSSSSALLEPEPPSTFSLWSAKSPYDVPRTSYVYVNMTAGDEAHVSSAVASAGHYVKHNSKLTLLLGGQKEGAKQPEFSNGGVIDGILTVPRPSALSSLEVKIEARIKLDDTAGSSSFVTTILDEVLFSWSSEYNSPFPSKVSFKYTLPPNYTNLCTGDQLRLPPSYYAELVGIPGFKVSVVYGLVVYLKHNKTEWWKDESRVDIPFLYRDLTRPERSGPFPSNLLNTPTDPKTFFQSTVRSRRGAHHDLQIQLYLPSSRVCSIKEPIPFFVTIIGNNESLEPFNEYQPSAISFHPLYKARSFYPNRLIKLKPRLSTSTPPLRIRLLRRTIVGNTLPDSTTPRDDRMAVTQILAEGTIHTATRGHKNVTWAGTIVIPPTVGCGGFFASGLQVVDSVILTHADPGEPNEHFLPYSEVVPIRLTTEKHDFPSAILVADWSW